MPILSPRVLTGDQIHRTGDIDIECGRGVSERDLPNFRVLLGVTYWRKLLVKLNHYETKKLLITQELFDMDVLRPSNNGEA